MPEAGLEEADGTLVALVRVSSEQMRRGIIVDADMERTPTPLAAAAICLPV